MIVEYRRKGYNIYWRPCPADWKIETIIFEHYSIRINKDRQYHRAGVPGFEEAFKKSMCWMQLAND